MSYLCGILKAGVIKVQVGRLFEIVYLLMQKGNITAGQLSERLGVSERTIYRDLDLLSSAGIPVYASQGKGGGIRLLDSFVLNKSLLTNEEQKEILAALQSLRAVKDTDTGGALEKLSTVFRQNMDSWVEIDFSNWGPASKERFLLLKNAVLQKRVVAFDYYNSRGERISRQAEPLQLWFKDRAWFLKAYCCTRGAFRIFKISRMKNITVSDAVFTQGLADISYDESAAPIKMVTLTLQINADLAYRVYDEFDENAIEQNADGSFTVRVSFPEGEWIYGYVLSFGPGIKVVEPKDIRRDIQQRIRLMLQNY
jgi:predicted DNA-binding transcriptional regulator YafY